MTFCPLLHGVSGAAAGVGGLAGIAGHLLNRRFEFAEGVADQRRIVGLVFRAAVHFRAEIGQGPAAAGDLFGVQVNGAHQIRQIGPQPIEGRLDILQLTVAGAHVDVVAEVAFGPGRQGRRQVRQSPGQASLQGVDKQCDQQNQADHHPLDQPDLALDLPVLGTHHGLQGIDRLLHVGGFHMGGVAQFGALLDQLAGTRQLRGIASEQAVEFALEGDAGVFCDRFVLVLQTHQRGEIIAGGIAAGCHAQQRQAVQLTGLRTDTGHFPLDITGQLAAPAADQLVPGEGQPPQVLRCVEQQRQVARGTVGVRGELVQVGAQFTLGLQQQGLGIAGQLAGGQQIGLAETVQARQARPEGAGQFRGKLIQFFLQGVEGLAGGAEAQGVATGQIILDVARHLALELPGQAVVALHQQVRTLQGDLGPP
ncbi:hypothetical protein [Pseudomonas mediterranea]|uniref:hypothetical protein n=1 Tax=Pseudomonas mediterranea TaxID=183795 RepID=UPI003B96E784